MDGFTVCPAGNPSIPISASTAEQLEHFLISKNEIMVGFLRLFCNLARVRSVVSGSCTRSIYLPLWLVVRASDLHPSPQGSVEFEC